MNILGYVKKYGDKTFKQMPFNEVDALIFSELAYINFDLSVPHNKFISLARLSIEDKKAFYTGSVDQKFNEKLVDAMMVSNRYKHIRIGFCHSQFDKKKYLQFFALTILLPDKTGFISFRGTDTSLLGWREDLLIAYSDDMPSQRMSVDYVIEMSKKINTNFYIGGHSKGGNLAIYSALNLTPEIEERVINVFSFDGPGFRNDICKLESYSRMEHKIIKYLTSNDMIGVIYNRILNPRIVYSNGILLGGHDPFRWKVAKTGESFEYAETRSKNSEKFEEGVMNWLTTIADDDKQLAIDVLYHLFGDSENIYDLLLKSARLIVRAKQSLVDYTSVQIAKTEEIFRRLGRFLFRAYSPRKYLKAKKPNESATIEEINDTTLQ